jgi:hypothetical protein
MTSKQRQFADYLNEIEEIEAANKKAEQDERDAATPPPPSTTAPPSSPPRPVATPPPAVAVASLPAAASPSRNPYKTPPRSIPSADRLNAIWYGAPKTPEELLFIAPTKKAYLDRLTALKQQKKKADDEFEAALLASWEDLEKKPAAKPKDEVEKEPLLTQEPPLRVEVTIADEDDDDDEIEFVKVVPAPPEVEVIEPRRNVEIAVTAAGATTVRTTPTDPPIADVVNSMPVASIPVIGVSNGTDPVVRRSPLMIPSAFIEFYQKLLRLKLRMQKLRSKHVNYVPGTSTLVPPAQCSHDHILAAFDANVGAAHRFIRFYNSTEHGPDVQLCVGIMSTLLDSVSQNMHF